MLDVIDGQDGTKKTGQGPNRGCTMAGRGLCALRPDQSGIQGAWLMSLGQSQMVKKMDYLSVHEKWDPGGWAAWELACDCRRDQCQCQCQRQCHDAPGCRLLQHRCKWSAAAARISNAALPLTAAILVVDAMASMMAFVTSRVQVEDGEDKWGANAVP